MKIQAVVGFALGLSAFASLAGAAESASIYGFAAYTKYGITASCSDYTGRTASGGPIDLHNFLVQGGNDDACALSSGAQITTYAGAIQDASAQPGCVAAKNFDSNFTVFSNQVRSKLDYSALDAEIVSESAKFHAQPATSTIVRLELSASSFAPQRTLHLNARAGQTLVIDVSGEVVNFTNMGLAIAPGLTGDRILWNFYEAKNLGIRFAGTDPVGIPGTILAPYANVRFQDARVTGAIYALRIVGDANGPECIGSVSGQINSMPYRGARPGVPSAPVNAPNNSPNNAPNNSANNSANNSPN